MLGAECLCPKSWNRFWFFSEGRRSVSHAKCHFEDEMIPPRIKRMRVRGAGKSASVHERTFSRAVLLPPSVRLSPSG